MIQEGNQLTTVGSPGPAPTSRTRLPAGTSASTISASLVHAGSFTAVRAHAFVSDEEMASRWTQTQAACLTRRHGHTLHRKSWRISWRQSAGHALPREPGGRETRGEPSSVSLIVLFQQLQGADLAGKVYLCVEGGKKAAHRDGAAAFCNVTSALVS